MWLFRLTDRSDMTLDVYRERKTTIQRQQHLSESFIQDGGDVYDFEIMIWNHVSDSGKSNAPLVLQCLSFSFWYSFDETFLEIFHTYIVSSAFLTLHSIFC